MTITKQIALIASITKIISAVIAIQLNVAHVANASLNRQEVEIMLTEKDKEVISTLENMPIKIDNVAQGNIYLDAINYAIEKIKGRKTGTWNYTEYSQKFEGGGSLLMRGCVCSECGCFIRKKH